ncbi:MAG TPA: TetR/AcrR family transcriptional regulator [Stellaceae bacterium]|jgi:TetR/AcrR family transcriptional repressor of nem operon|nr:TetR/AcrR family transcriptional regulator [Stellaceae bacterium]
MRYADDHKQQTHERLVKEAAAMLRAEGPERMSVATLMAKLGLTHGGFYAHFRSKDVLIAEAIDATFDQMAERFAKRIEGLSPADALSLHIDSYLSALHQDGIGDGCPLPAIAADVARLSPLAKARFGAGVQRLHGRIAALFEGLGYDAAEAKEQAVSLYCELAGTVALARAVDPDQARAIRANSRAALRKRFGLSAPAAAA